MPTLSWKIDQSISDRVEAFALEVNGVTVRDTGGAFAELEALGRALSKQHEGKLIGSIEGIGDARSLYKAFGVDPTRTRPSSEALLRRCLKGQDLYRINEAVDVGNWVSLEYLLPLGLYDRDLVRGEEAIVRVGGDGEEYEGIRKGPVHLTGRLCVADAEGAFGSPTSDSLRTSVRDTTRNLAAIVFAPAGIEAERLRSAGEALARRLGHHCRAEEFASFPVGG